MQCEKLSIKKIRTSYFNGTKWATSENKFKKNYILNRLKWTRQRQIVQLVSIMHVFFWINTSMAHCCNDWVHSDQQLYIYIYILYHCLMLRTLNITSTAAATTTAISDFSHSYTKFVFDMATYELYIQIYITWKI